MKKQPEDVKPHIESLNFSGEPARAVINSLSAHIAILDKEGVILETNRAWNTYSLKNGMPDN
ncbi:MAG: hypothetical protein QNL11_00520 [Desulfobacterales bacterium]|jgi:hypothetical protein|nr:hypothetical protein [Desulfobacterales bacterium]